MKRIFVVTAARSDYGILRPVIRAISDHPELSCELLVCGAHLSERFGKTVKAIEADGFNIVANIENTLPTDSPEDIAHSTALAINGFARAFTESKPDALVILGDRYEMLAAATAALPFNIPLIHIHGGEVTRGAIDDAIRHAISKMSHLHFPATQTSRERLIRMGENPANIHCVGAPGLDRIGKTNLMSLPQLGRLLDIKFKAPPILATFHPATRSYEQTASQVDAVFSALDNIPLPVVVSFPGADTGAQAVIDRIQRFAAEHLDRVRLITNLDDRAYLSMMSVAAAMVGNSSSGIIEAASFALPVLDIGDRQGGREHGANVIHVEANPIAIAQGLNQVLAPEFRNSIKAIVNPYGQGNASQMIAAHIAQTDFNPSMIAKSFYETTGDST